MAWNGSTSPSPSEAAHTDTAVPVLDLARVGDHAAGAAADQRHRGEHLVDCGERRLRRRHVRAGGEQHGEIARAAVEPASRGGRRFQRARPGVGRGREAGGDVHAHSSDDTPGRAGDRDLRPDRRRQDRGRDRARRAAARRGRGPGRDLRRRACRSTTGCRSSPGAATRRGSGAARAPPRRLRAGRPSRSARAPTPRAAHAEIDGAIAAGRRPIVVGGTGLYLRAALAELDLRPPVPDGRARWEATLAASAARRRCTRSWRARAPEAAAGIAPARRQAARARRSSCSRRARSCRRAERVAAVDRRTRATRRCWPGW